MQRRTFLLALAAATVVSPAFAQGRPMKIGVIGSGRIGSTIGGLWVKAGHEVMFSDRAAEQVKRAIDGLGPELRAKARAGSVPEAAAFGDAVLIAVPYMALPAIRDQVGAQLKGKVVIDPNNPVPSRDGEMAVSAREKGAHRAQLQCLGLRHHGARSEPPGAAHGVAGRRRRCRRAEARHAACLRCGLRSGGRRLARCVESLRPRFGGLRPDTHRRRAAPGAVAQALKFKP